MCQCFMSRSRSALWSVCTNRSLTCQCLKKSKRASSWRVETPPVAVQRQVPQLQTVAKTGVFPSINQVTKHAVFPPILYIDKIIAAHACCVMQRLVPPLQTVPKTGEESQTQFIGNFVDVPVISQIQVTKHVEISQKHFIDKVVAVPMMMQRLVPQLQTLL